MKVSSINEAAAGVIQLANANMERAIRRISVERGYDPRRFTLVAFGGAGPLHACELAQNLGIPRVLVPTVPGVLSALGMLAAAPTKDYSQTIMHQIGEDEVAVAAWLDEQFRQLIRRAEAEMTQEGYDPLGVKIVQNVDMRYIGQSHELTIPYRTSRLSSAFHAAHEVRYGYQRPEAEVEIVTLRVTAVAQIAQLQLQERVQEPAAANNALLGEKQVWFKGQMMAATLYERSRLQAGHYFSGPAVVFQYDTTTIVPPAWEASVDNFENLILVNGVNQEELLSPDSCWLSNTKANFGLAHIRMQIDFKSCLARSQYQKSCPWAYV